MCKFSEHVVYAKCVIHLHILSEGFKHVIHIFGWDWVKTCSTCYTFSRTTHGIMQDTHLRFQWVLPHMPMENSNVFTELSWSSIICLTVKAMNILVVGGLIKLLEKIGSLANYRHLWEFAQYFGRLANKLGPWPIFWEFAQFFLKSVRKFCRNCLSQ